jgi:hypothetical protein
LVSFDQSVDLVLMQSLAPLTGFAEAERRPAFGERSSKPVLIFLLA